MDDIEFKPYGKDDLKRIGTGEDKSHEVKKSSLDRTKFDLKNFKYLIVLIMVVMAILLYKYYEKNVLYPSQTKTELLEIKSALYLYKENFDSYPTQLTELTKGRPLRDIWLTDAWGNSYRYELDDSQQLFKIISAGNDETFGTNDDIMVK